MTKTKALQDYSRVQDLLVNASQENKRMTPGRWKVRKWQTHSDSRCTAANNKLHCFTMTKKKKHKEAGGLLNEPNSCNVIKHGKHWLIQFFHFDFSGGQMRNSLLLRGRCLCSCPLTLFTQFNVEIVLLLHLKSLASAFDMIYWAGKPLFLYYPWFFCLSVHCPRHPPPPAAPCYLCCCWALINIS